MMKHLMLCSVMSVMIFNSCTKSESDKRHVQSSLQIVNTITPVAVSKGSTINARIISEAPNLCYSFSHFEVKAASDKIFDIRSIANLPPGELICAQAIYRVDSVLRIPTPETGTYILRFYNQQQLFKSDTVSVN